MRVRTSFDAQTEQYVDMPQAGIIDPEKAVRAALQNAASVAGLLITTEAMVAEAPKKETTPAMPGGGGDHGFTQEHCSCHELRQTRRRGGLVGVLGQNGLAGCDIDEDGAWSRRSKGLLSRGCARQNGNSRCDPCR